MPAHHIIYTTTSLLFGSDSGALESYGGGKEWCHLSSRVLNLRVIMLLHWALGDDDDDDDGGDADDGAGQYSGHGGYDDGDVIFFEAFSPFSLIMCAAKHFSLSSAEKYHCSYDSSLLNQMLINGATSLMYVLTINAQCIWGEVMFTLDYYMMCWSYRTNITSHYQFHFVLTCCIFFLLNIHGRYLLLLKNPLSCITL